MCLEMENVEDNCVKPFIFAASVGLRKPQGGGVKELAGTFPGKLDRPALFEEHGICIKNAVY